MKKILTLLGFLSFGISSFAQTNPAITEWLINTTGLTGRHYVDGNSTPIENDIPANVQTVQYSDDFSYISCSGIPSYIVGPYLDGNPSIASDNSNIYKIPLIPVENTGTPTGTGLGAIGVFLNGVAMYDWQDGFSYIASSGQDGSPNGGMGDGIWNRDAVVAEKAGFDCAKGHPSPIFGAGMSLEGGFYHHHQNPSAFNLDLVEISDVCDLYLADGLYVIDSTEHSPLLGYAYDGYPLYGAYGYANADGTGAIKRIESSYQLRDIIVRTEYADGTDVSDGPDISDDFPLGWYTEDYEYIESSGDLDDHNGRFCVTPEYPEGTYCYFTTVDENWNSYYPYMIGTYYGVVTGANVDAISETVTTYIPVTTAAEDNELASIKVNVFPNPAIELIAIQIDASIKDDINLELFDISGKSLAKNVIYQGSTIAHFDTRTIYAGDYLLVLSNGDFITARQIAIVK